MAAPRVPTPAPRPAPVVFVPSPVPPPVTEQQHRHLLHTVSLLSTLRTAAHVHRQMAERRAGRDPSAQEPAGAARAYLREALQALEPLLARLRFYAAVGAEGGDPVQHFEARLALLEAAREVHRVHQRLLSLYPDVSADLAEHARRIQADFARLLEEDGDGFADALAAATDDAFACLGSLREALR